MEQALRALLLANAGVAAIVGSRVAWAERPQGSALPSIILHRIDGQPGYHMEGPGDLVESRVQVDCWGDTYASIRLTADAVKAVLNGMRGDHGGIHFKGVFLVGESDGREAGANDADRFFRVILDFIIHHSEV